MTGMGNTSLLAGPFMARRHHVYLMTDEQDSKLHQEEGAR